MGITRCCREFSPRCVAECVIVVGLCCSLNSDLRIGPLRRKVLPVLKSLNMTLHRLLLFLTTHRYPAHTSKRVLRERCTKDALKVGLHRLTCAQHNTGFWTFWLFVFWCVFFFSEKAKESMRSSWRRAAASCGLISIRVDCGLGGRRQNKTNTGLNS